jgi:hypothetical protein
MMARLQRAFFTPGAADLRAASAARPLKASFFGLIFWGFLDFFDFFCFFLLFLRLRPWVTGVGYLNFYIFKGTLFSIMFGDAIFD